MSTPLTPRGMPWRVTQSIARSAWFKSSESLRTVWTPGTTNVPFPVTILNPSPSWMPEVSLSFFRPEMISASLGSATLHISLNRTIATTRTAATMITMVSAMTHPLSWLHLGDDDRAGWEVLDDHDAGAGGEDVGAVSGVSVERFCSAPDRNHHFPELAGRDAAGDSADLAHHFLIRHALILDRSDGLECTSSKEG